MGRRTPSVGGVSGGGIGRMEAVVCRRGGGFLDDQDEGCLGLPAPGDGQFCGENKDARGGIRYFSREWGLWVGRGAARG